MKRPERFSGFAELIFQLRVLVAHGVLPTGQKNPPQGVEREFSREHVEDMGLYPAERHSEYGSFADHAVLILNRRLRVLAKELVHAGENSCAFDCGPRDDALPPHFCRLGLGFWRFWLHVVFEYQVDVVVHFFRGRVEEIDNEQLPEDRRVSTRQHAVLNGMVEKGDDRKDKHKVLKEPNGRRVATRAVQPSALPLRVLVLQSLPEYFDGGVVPLV
mmetsp:Transcript_9045/g.22120  ORF Transcript_9045/g.22120 Transcript_9045/m.22120 type:complete len:216 (+) Transcript_9045:3432-4079(+)